MIYEKKYSCELMMLRQKFWSYLSIIITAFQLDGMGLIKDGKELKIKKQEKKEGRLTKK